MGKDDGQNHEVLVKKIGITHRVEVLNSHKETRDCLDQAWYRLLFGLSLIPVPLPNVPGMAETLFTSLRLEGLILTGGNNIGESACRDDFETEALKYCISHGLPVLGVCRGLQLINVQFGGTLRKVDGHVATRHRLNVKAFELPDEVNSYHNFALAHVPSELSILATDKKGNAEAVKHEFHPVWGIMWHPEREFPTNLQDSALIETIFGRTTTQ